MMDEDDELAQALGRVRALEHQLSIANQHASSAMVATRRLRRWFEQYPSHPSRSRTMYELEREEQTALDEMSRLRQQLAKAQQELDDLYVPVKRSLS